MEGGVGSTYHLEAERRVLMRVVWLVRVLDFGCPGTLAPGRGRGVCVGHGCMGKPKCTPVNLVLCDSLSRPAPPLFPPTLVGLPSPACDTRHLDKFLGPLSRQSRNIQQDANFRQDVSILLKTLPRLMSPSVIHPHPS